MATGAQAVARTQPTTSRVSGVAAGVGRWGVLIALALTIVIPVAYAALGGFKTNYQMPVAAVGFPAPCPAENSPGIPADGAFGRRAPNTLVIAIATAALVVVTASLAAFIFARHAFPGREAVFTLFTLGLLFPSAVAILPLFILVRSLGLLDNPLGIVLPQAAFALPMTVVILRPFLMALPKELEEAAAIDGCGPFGFFWRILLPLVRPALAAVAVLTMVYSWNDFFLPLLVLNSEKLYTLPLGIQQFQGQFSTNWALVLAFISLSLVPTIIFYLLLERQIIAGLTAGAVKG